jgi:hypothetical protein
MLIYMIIGRKGAKDAKARRTQSKFRANKTREIFALFAPLRQELTNQEGPCR